MFFNNNKINLALIKQLDAANLRQKVIADNIANINTPNFKKSKVMFEEELKKALSKKQPRLLTSHPRHISNIPALSQLEPKVVKMENTTMRVDGNNVDLDEEMINLVRNTLVYRTAAQIFNMRKSIISEVIRGGR